MSLTVYRAFVLIGSMILFLLLSIHLFYTSNLAAVKLDHGSKMDSGIFPKRTRNINAWYLVAADAAANSGAYPTIYTAAQPHTGLPARIGIASTTVCPIFRAQDNGSTNPLLIG